MDSIGKQLLRPEGGHSPSIESGSDDSNESDGSQGAEEDAESHTMVRMLEDNQGRLQYIGDSSNLSFLQLLRMIVETISGQTPFSANVSRHKFTEREFSISPDVDVQSLLPTQATAMILIDAFFAQTHGAIEVFIEKLFVEKVERSYRNQTQVDRPWLCHFYLVLAIGLSLVTPLHGSREEAIINNLRGQYPHYGQEYYFAAKKMCDPLTGFEDAGFWSVQALTLMSVFMLNIGRRNTAYIFTGMAIRLAHALGVHRDEVEVMFSPPEQEERRKIWRTLCILDLFLSTTLGRPLAMSEHHHTDKILNTAAVPGSIDGKPETRHVCGAALEANLRSSHVMGHILQEIYLPRRMSIRKAQKLAGMCRDWPKRLAPYLSWRLASSDDPRAAIAILHCNLSYCHSVILLSRPFYLHLLSNELQRDRLHLDVEQPRMLKEIQKFSNACVDACAHVIAITYTAYVGGYLPRLNPFASYCVFAAALVIFVNELARPNTNAVAEQCMGQSIALLEYSGVADPQASRAVDILKEFSNVINKDRGSNINAQQVAQQFQGATLPDRSHYVARPNLQEPNLPPQLNFSGGPMGPFETEYHPPMNQSNLPFSNVGQDQWMYPLEEPMPDFGFGNFPELDFLDFGTPLPPDGSVTSTDMDQNFDFDSLGKWPPNVRSPPAGMSHSSSDMSQGAPFRRPHN